MPIREANRRRLGIILYTVCLSSPYMYIGLYCTSQLHRGSNEQREMDAIRDLVCAQITNRQKFVETFTACDLLNLTFRPGFIIPQTSDDSFFAVRVTDESVYIRLSFGRRGAWSQRGAHTT